MANTKKITLDYSETAVTVYAIIRREVDSFRLNDTNGTFTTNPADPYVTLTEDSIIKGRYELNENRSVWDDGQYTSAIYKQAGGSPSPVADIIIGTGEMWIVNDAEFTLTSLPTSAVNAVAVWDEILTKNTHNIANSAGKIVRQLRGMTVHEGTAQAGGLNTITLDVGASAENNIYKESLIVILAGTAAGEAHHVLSYNGATKVAVIDQNWYVQPDATSDFIMFGSSGRDTVESGIAQAAAATSITLDGTASASDDIYLDQMIFIPSGTGSRQVRRITDYVGATKVATVDKAWVITPDSTSGYMLYPAVVFSADVKKMNAATVTGNGTSGDLWRGA